MDKCEWYINEALKLFNETISDEGDSDISWMFNIFEIVDEGLLPKCKIGNSLETSKIYIPKAVVPFLLLLIYGDSKAIIRFLYCDSLISHCNDSVFTYEYLKKNLSYFENSNNFDNEENNRILVHAILFMLFHEGGHVYWSLGVSDDIKKQASEMHDQIRIHNSFRGFIIRKFSNIIIPLLIYLFDKETYKKRKKLDRELRKDLCHALVNFNENYVNKQNEEYFADLNAFIFSEEIYNKEHCKRELFIRGMLCSLNASQYYIFINRYIELEGNDNIKEIADAYIKHLMFNSLRIRSIRTYLYYSFKKLTERKVVNKMLNTRALLKNINVFNESIDLDNIAHMNVFDMEYRFDYSNDDLQHLFNEVQTCIMNKLVNC